MQPLQAMQIATCSRERREPQTSARIALLASTYGIASSVCRFERLLKSVEGAKPSPVPAPHVSAMNTCPIVAPCAVGEVYSGLLGAYRPILVNVVAHSLPENRGCAQTQKPAPMCKASLVEKIHDARAPALHLYYSTNPAICQYRIGATEGFRHTRCWWICLADHCGEQATKRQCG